VIAKWIDKHAGPLALLWVVAGFHVLMFGVAALVRLVPGFERFDVSEPLFAIVAFLGFGVGILLVVAGLRRGNRLGRICSFSAIRVVVLAIAVPVLGIDRAVGNLFRTDEFAPMYDGAPECIVAAGVDTQEEIAAFHETISRFATQHQLRECKQKEYARYSGPLRPTHKGARVAIWANLSRQKSSAETRWQGSVRLWAYDATITDEEFRQVADSLEKMMRSTFSDRTWSWRRPTEITAQ
jgi:hypothetical protein